MLWYWLVACLIAIIFGVVKFSLYRMPRRKRETAGQVLLEKIVTGEYTKTTLPNNYPEYPGELEETDAREYLEFIDSGILDYIK